MPDVPELRDERVGRLRIRRRADVPLDAILEALKVPGELLKESHKARTRRVGPWVVKESRPTPVERLKHALRPGRYRSGWKAALRLAERGIGAPAPVAHVETRTAGFLDGHATVLEYLDGWPNVEEFARSLVAQRANAAQIARFLENLAGAVNALAAAHACHTDLSGKNILTQAGQAFAFIDLDGVVLDRPFSDSLRLLNHVQLYDSFCDLWDDALLGPFLARMLPPDRDLSEWLNAVRARQSVRRSRTEAIWRRQGRLGR